MFFFFLFSGSIDKTAGDSTTFRVLPCNHDWEFGKYPDFRAGASRAAPPHKPRRPFLHVTSREICVTYRQIEFKHGSQRLRCWNRLQRTSMEMMKEVKHASVCTTQKRRISRQTASDVIGSFATSCLPLSSVTDYIEPIRLIVQ